MQANPSTRQEGSARIPDTDFGEHATPFLSAPQQLHEAHALYFHTEFASQDYELSRMPVIFAPRILGNSIPYVSRSASRRVFYEFSKRGFDITASLALLVLTLPLFLVITILIKMTSPGPVLFSHSRLGRRGKRFGCLKFRTMVMDAEEHLRRNVHLQREFEKTFKLKGDPRITRLGSILRRTSLDELPQLLQVLRGDMSIIGPRPIVERELGKYAIYGDKLLTVKPGLSGLWQVCGRSETTYPQRVMMDMYYIDHRSLWLDIKLFLLTSVAVIRKSGAY